MKRNNDYEKIVDIMDKAQISFEHSGNLPDVNWEGFLPAR